MSDITVKMKDGSYRRFPHIGRSGGSYTKHLTFEGAFVVIEDEWHKRTAIPVTDIEEITEIPR